MTSVTSQCFSSRAAALVALAVAAVGCQRTVAPVSGRVTLNGQPLAGATVTFQPRGTNNDPRPPGSGSVGRTDSRGRYSLRMVKPDQAGAVVGLHQVTISTPTITQSSAPSGGSDPVETKPSPLPEAWRDGSQQFRVPAGGTSQADFDITVAEPPPPKAKAKRKR